MIPSFLNNLTKQSNYSPNIVSGNLDSRNLNLSAGQAPDMSSLGSVLGGLIPAEPFKGVPVKPVVPVPVAPVAQVPVNQTSYNQSAIRAGNTNNPLNQYSNQFGQNYMDQNIGGYNPVAEYHRLQGERTANLLQKTGPYAIPSDLPVTADELQRIRAAGDTYYENQLAMTRGEAQDTMGNIKSTVTGGVLGTLPPMTAQKVDEIRKEYSEDPSTRGMMIIQNVLNQAQGVYEKNKDNPGLANGTDDYRMLFLLSNAMNPNSEVSEGDYANAQQLMGTLAPQIQSWVSKYIQKNPDGTYDLSDIRKGFLTPVGRKAIYDAIQEHYNETIINNEFFRKQKADLIDSYSGRQGLGEQITRSVVNPVNVSQTQHSSQSGGSPYAEQW